MLLFRYHRIGYPTFEERHLDTVVPFRAWRYSPEAGDLAELVAPPYDVIGPVLQSRLYARSPNNVVRIDLGLTTPSDNDCDNRYTRAADLLERWRESGVLVRDPEPTLTFVQEEFTGPDGLAGKRHGLLAAFRLSKFGEGPVFPHEQTLAGPKEDRFRLMTATAMNLSPVFLLYDLPGDEITTAWKNSLAEATPTSTVEDDAGTVTRLWSTSDPRLLGLVTGDLADSRFLVADGHHRYETALRYQEVRGGAPGKRAGSAQASDYCLVYLTNMSDPALAIYPTHRLVGGLSEEAVRRLPDSLNGSFEVKRLDGPAREAIAAYLREHTRGAFGMWGPWLDAPYGLRLVDTSSTSTQSEGSDTYGELDVTVLQTLILQRALGVSPESRGSGRRLAFFKDAEAAFASLEAGDHQLGFFLNPVDLDQVRELAFGGERMPQKTTYFHPKLPTGLVFQDLTGVL